MGKEDSEEKRRRSEKYPESYVYGLLCGENGLTVIRNLMKGGMGFNELMRRSGISSAKTLSNTLKRLIEHNVVRKEIVMEPVGSGIYVLTENGKQLFRVVYVMHSTGKKLLKQERN